jgi:hypothetical protein
MKHTREPVKQNGNGVHFKTGHCLATTYSNFNRGIKGIANAERITALWNAADGKSNEDAVKALENHEEIVNTLKTFAQYYGPTTYTRDTAAELLAKLEGK